MTDAAAFEAAIRADPSAGMHLIYADWLDDHGQEDFARRLREPWAQAAIERWTTEGGNTPLQQALVGHEALRAFGLAMGRALPKMAEVAGRIQQAFASLPNADEVMRRLQAARVPGEKDRSPPIPGPEKQS